jgi:hypothetical protein
MPPPVASPVGVFGVEQMLEAWISVAPEEDTWGKWIEVGRPATDQEARILRNFRSHPLPHASLASWVVGGGVRGDRMPGERWAMA